MRKHFVWVLLITIVSFTACSRKDSIGQQMRDDNTTISVDAVKIATLTYDGNIDIDYSEAKVIRKFNKKNPGFRLDSIGISDLDKESLDSKVILSLFAYDSLKKEQHTFDINTIMKVADKNNNIGYYIHSDKNCELFRY